MADELVFHTNPMSRGRIVRWMLEEVGAPYRVVIHEYGPAMKSPEYLALNPLGKVPVIEHGKRVVPECAAICAYLADAFPEAGLAPPLAERHDYYRWLFFTVGPFEASVVDKSLGREAPEEKRGMSPYGEASRVMDALEQALAGRDYVAAGRFTAADVLLGAHLWWGLQFGTVEKRPGFREYVDRLTARAAHARAMALDDAAMPAKTSDEETGAKETGD